MMNMETGNPHYSALIMVNTFRKRKSRIRFSVVQFYFSVHGIHRITTILTIIRNIFG